MVEEAWLDEGDQIIAEESMKYFERLIKLEKAVIRFIDDVDKGGYNWNTRFDELKQLVKKNK